MKKIVLVLSSLLVMGISAGAQEFVPGWNFQVKGGIDAMIGETMTFTNAITPEGAIAVGYKFTPVIGARLDFSGLKSGNKDYKWGFFQPSLDLTVDLCNLFGDYKFRTVNPYFLAGFGGLFYYGNDEAVALSRTEPLKAWEGPKFGPSGRIGGGIDFFVGKAFAITLEASGNALPDNINSNIGGAPDGRLAAYVGLKYDLSRAKSVKATDDKIAAAAAAAAAAKAAADKAAAEKAAAEAAAAAKAAADKAAAEKAAAEKAAAERAAAERAAARQSANNILFVIGQSKIRDNQKDKLQAVIDMANAYPEAKIIVSGYADKETGSAAWNMKLSQKRAENVTKALVENGIAADRIVTEYYGSEVNPFDTPAENRVAVAVTR